MTGSAYAEANDTELHRSKFTKRRITLSVVIENTK